VPVQLQTIRLAPSKIRRPLLVLSLAWLALFIFWITRFFTDSSLKFLEIVVTGLFTVGFALVIVLWLAYKSHQTFTGPAARKLVVDFAAGTFTAKKTRYRFQDVFEVKPWRHGDSREKPDGVPHMVFVTQRLYENEPPMASNDWQGRKVHKGYNGLFIDLTPRKMRSADLDGLLRFVNALPVVNDPRSGVSKQAVLAALSKAFTRV